MDPVYPWLDPIEVRRMANRLMKPNHGSSVTDVGFNAGFVGYATGTTARQFAPPPAVPAAAPTPPPSVEVTPQSEVTFNACGPFLDRITRFRDWMRHNFAATGIFILNREGAVIFDESNHGRLHFLARSLALASRRPGASAGNVHIKIGAGSTLEVIPVETAIGCLVLGAVVPESLAPSSVSAVMEALSLVATPPPEEPKTQPS
jgi:hypothetical protein